MFGGWLSEAWTRWPFTQFKSSVPVLLLMQILFDTAPHQLLLPFDWGLKLASCWHIIIYEVVVFFFSCIFLHFKWHDVSAVCTRDINLWFFIFQGSLCNKIMAIKTSAHMCFPLFNIWIILYYMEFIQLFSVLYDDILITSAILCVEDFQQTTTWWNVLSVLKRPEEVCPKPEGRCTGWSFSGMKHQSWE